METPKPKPPRRIDDRIVVHFDYDCFYAQVVENQQPALRCLPLGIRQKSILATCNYVARRAGVTKLMAISDATKICPELVLVDGEDLSAFRDVSKKMYRLLRSCSWNNRVERLGLDEYFMDVTDMVDYNVELLNPNAPDQSFFCLSRDDPEMGFGYDASSVAGCLSGSPVLPQRGDVAFAQYLRLLVASHLARHIRMQIEEQGYTSAAGISTSKLLSKLVGSRNKPRNQTTLLAFADEHVWSFMDMHKLRAIPGIGSRTTGILESHLRLPLPSQVPDPDPCPDPDQHSRPPGKALAAGRVRSAGAMSAHLLERLLGGPGAERGIGEKTWRLLHGVDDAPVKEAGDLPAQIGIEDTYRAGLNEPAEVAARLRLLAASLLRRMHVDLVEDVAAEEDGDSGDSDDRAEAEVGAEVGAQQAEEKGKRRQTDSRRRWIAHPKTIRLSTRPKTRAAEHRPYNHGRASRSAALPGFVFCLTSPPGLIADRLVDEVLLPLFRRLNPGPRGWNVGMLNVCVANLVVVAAGAGGEGAGVGGGRGRDIGVMFRRQEDVLRQWTVYDEEGGDGGNQGGGQDGTPACGGDAGPSGPAVEEARERDDSEDEGWEEDDRDALETCTRCGHLIPSFALVAHKRYHDMEP